MSKFVSIAAALALLVLTVSQDASAGWRRCRRQTVWYAPATVAAPAPVASPPPVNSQAVPRTANGSTYRSYSFEPTTVAPAPAPYTYSQPTLAPSQARFFRADRKAHGMSWYRNQ